MKASFFYQIKPLEGLKIKEISKENIENKDCTKIVFNDKFGTALYFDEKGRFVIQGTTTKYIA